MVLGPSKVPKNHKKPLIFFEPPSDVPTQPLENGCVYERECYDIYSVIIMLLEATCQHPGLLGQP